MPDQDSKVEQWYSLVKTFSYIKTSKKRIDSDSESSASSSAEESSDDMY